MVSDKEFLSSQMRSSNRGERGSEGNWNKHFHAFSEGGQSVFFFRRRVKWRGASVLSQRRRIATFNISQTFLAESPFNNVLPGSDHFWKTWNPYLLEWWFWWRWSPVQPDFWKHMNFLSALPSPQHGIISSPQHGIIPSPPTWKTLCSDQQSRDRALACL